MTNHDLALSPIDKLRANVKVPFNVLYGGGMSADWCADPDAPRHLAAIKALLDDVNIEDKGCVERVYQGLCAQMSTPGTPSHLERPNFEFAHYIASRIGQ